MQMLAKLVGPRAARARVVIAILMASAGAAVAAPPNVRHVRADAPAGGDGLTWGTAYNDLRAALSAASASGGAVTELWVRQGVYIPAGPGGTDPAISFTLVPGVAVYGGFAGTETDRTQRNPFTRETILEGNTGAARAYNVVIAAGDAATVLDGFTVRGGRASAPDTSGTGWAGGGIHVTGSPTISACRIIENATQRPLSSDTVFRKGGGVYCAPGSAATFIGCTIADNAGADALMVTGGAGGGLAADDCLVRITRCTIRGNRSGDGGWGPCEGGVMTGGFDGGPGGGIYFGPGVSALIERCAIRGNITGTSITPHVCVLPPVTEDCKDAGDGGAIYAENAFVSVVNSLFIDNATADGSPGQDGSPSTASDGGDGGDGAAVWATGGSVLLVNCTFVGNIPGMGGVGSEAFPVTGKPAGLPGIDGVGAAAWAGPAAHLENCIVWNGGIAEIIGGATASYSNIEGGFAGTGNINADPRFLNEAGGDLRLREDSPCIDAANSLIDINPFSPGDQPLPELDAGGFDRRVNVPEVPDTGVGPPVVDMGAYEVQHPCLVDFNGDGMVDFADYLEFLNLYDAADPRADLNGDGLVDFSDYLEFLNLYDGGC
ncbi:MAG: right-handed parallel beta-helix repeat-containing protein [Phycisphaerales bacterium]|nr:right-handed parallel beta-helix repeat-containing protein [Phycisphaerales bacterium]